MGNQEDRREEVSRRKYPLIGWGFPWCYMRNLWGDSGFLEVWEPLHQMWVHHGVMSFMYLNRKYKGTEFPPPKESGIVPIFSPVEAWRPQYFQKYGVDAVWMQKIGAGVSTVPIDFVFTNCKLAVPQMLGVFSEPNGLPLSNSCNSFVPVFVDVLKVGRDTHDSMDATHEFLEALGFVCSVKSFFSTEREKELATAMVRRFFSDAEIRRFERHKAAIVPDGVSPEVQSIAFTDEEVRKRLCEPREEAKVAFVGRMNSNKNPGKVLQIMRRVYALDGVKLTVVTPTSRAIDSIFKEFPDIDVMTEAALEVDKESFLKKFLPSLDVILNASRHEGYTVSVAEAVSMGVPVLLPDKPWARALVGDDYPFFYHSDAEAVAKMRAVRDGKVDESIVAPFLESRRRFVNDGMDRCSEMIYGHVEKHVRPIDEYLQGRGHSRMLEYFREVTEVGQAFTFESLRAGLAKNFTLRRVGFVFDAMKIWKTFKPYVEIVDPKKLILRRVR